jgi:hypothetical protein
MINKWVKYYFIDISFVKALKNSHTKLFSHKIAPNFIFSLTHDSVYLHLILILFSS